MKEAHQYRQYAEECRRIAAAMPQHSDTLLNIAAAWEWQTVKAEKQKSQKNGDGQANSMGSPTPSK